VRKELEHDGLGVPCSDGVVQNITVTGGIGHNDLGGNVLDQDLSLRRITLRTGRQDKTD